MPQRVWTDYDLQPYLVGDTYDTSELPKDAQEMLHVAEQLADARREWSMPKREPRDGAGLYAMREPRHSQSSFIHRRGRSPNRQE